MGGAPGKRRRYTTKVLPQETFAARNNVATDLRNTEILLRRFGKFRIRHALIAQRLTSLVEVSINHFLRRGEFRLRFFAPPQPRQDLAAQEVYALIARRQPPRSIYRRQRLPVFSLLHINLGQTKKRCSHLRVTLQSFAEELRSSFVFSGTLIQLP